MTPKQEQIYIQGKKRAYTNVLRVCLAELNPDERSQSSWLEERNDTIVQLRELCAKFGDNDWSDDLYLADIIEKHLARYLFK